MPLCHDAAIVRPILHRDRWWALYLLGDLEPHLWRHCQVWCSDEAVALLYRRFDPPVLVAFGGAEAVRPLLSEMPSEPCLHLHVSPDVSALVQERWELPRPVHMQRMRLEPADYQPVPTSEVIPLRRDDTDEVEALYRDGDASGESPDFFAPEMLDEGIFFGLRREGVLVTVAGTHLVGRVESVAAIGNVYTRRDWRNRGLAALATSAVIDELLRAGIRTIGLSVHERNAAARRTYEGLGFRHHCDFIEGKAHLRA